MTTTAIFIRHAKPDTEGYADSDLHPLSDEGRKEMAQLAELLDRRGYRPNRVYTSPLLRAEQSGQVVADHFKLPFVSTEEALNTFDGDALLAKLPKPADEQTIVFVGHAPTLATFVNKLAGQTVLPDGLGKAEAAILEFDKEIDYGKASFKHYYKPEIL